jgi:hypothetical protein
VGNRDFMCRIEIFCGDPRFSVGNCGFLCKNRGFLWVIEIFCAESRFSVGNRGFVWGIEVFCAESRFSVANRDFLWGIEVFCEESRISVRNFTTESRRFQIVYLITSLHASLQNICLQLKLNFLCLCPGICVNSKM